MPDRGNPEGGSVRFVLPRLAQTNRRYTPTATEFRGACERPQRGARAGS